MPAVLRPSLAASALPKDSRKRVLFHLPVRIFEQCFAPQDLRRLEADYLAFGPGGNSDAEILAAWDRWSPSVDAVVTGWDSPRISERMLADAPNLGAIVHSAGSIRPFIPDSVWESGIRIASANDALGKGVAETTMGLIIAGLKGFFPCAALTRGGHWQQAIPSCGFGRVRELYDVTVGVIGASRTGRHVLRLLADFDAEVVLADPTIDADEARELGVRLVDLDNLLRMSDVVSLHAPALPKLRHMLQAREFALMKDDAIFINTARGMLVDEASLVDELSTGRISAILDVTFPEPSSADHPFRKLPNVVLLPHIAGALTTGCLRQGRSVVDQLLEFAAGNPMQGEITRSKFAVMA